MITPLVTVHVGVKFMTDYISEIAGYIKGVIEADLASYNETFIIIER